MQVIPMGRLLPVAVFLLTALVSAQTPADERATGTGLSLPPELKKIFAGGEPDSVAQLEAMEKYVQVLFEKILPSTVNIGGATGVIVPGGFVLTAGHVSRKAGRTIMVTLDDGRSVKTRSLGLSNRTDTGLLKIVSKGDYPALKMGRSSSLKLGEWCVMLGFPGGPRKGLKPPLRLGRVLKVVEPGRGYLVTDCTMSAGDSGGPLFDMSGRVIGINSRISRSLAQNMHTPIDAFHDEWSRLVKGEVIDRSGRRGSPTTPGWLGVLVDQEAENAKIIEVVKGSPADRAGVRVGDVILKLNSRKIRSSGTLARQEKKLWKGDRVRITLRRGGEEKVLRAEVGTKPEAGTGKKPKAQPGKQPEKEAPKKKSKKVIR
jgi:serine protease Do